MSFKKQLLSQVQFGYFPPTKKTSAQKTHYILHSEDIHVSCLQSIEIKTQKLTGHTLGQYAPPPGGTVDFYQSIEIQTQKLTGILLVI